MKMELPAAALMSLCDEALILSIGARGNQGISPSQRNILHANVFLVNACFSRYADDLYLYAQS